MRHLFKFIIISLLVLLSNMANLYASTAGAPHLNGAELSLLWVAPFACMLLSIAIFPLVAEKFWHHNFGKISLIWALSFILPFIFVYGGALALFEILHVLLLEYIPFIILLFALFTVAGGVRIRGKLKGTPLVNLGILLFGTIIASWMGTTGAAMLLIRPLIKANEWRTHRVHIIVFFIFLVANIGGALTPLGDPPLFLGFLKGVSFFWPTEHLLLPMIFVSVILLTVFFLLDSYYYRKEGELPDFDDLNKDEPDGIKIEGIFNILLIGGVVAAVLLSGMWSPDISFDIFYVKVELQNIARDILLLIIAGLSWKFTNIHSRMANGFSWFPIMEVAKIFVGIFLTIIPAIAILKAGMEGELSAIISAVSDENGDPINMMYFWATGILSSFLDNAPTYLVFFETAGGDAVNLMGKSAMTLLAISMGAVFMGANTYIGNAPNFMVRSIAEERGIKMPSFFGYMGYSIIILMPLFALTSYVFF